MNISPVSLRRWAGRIRSNALAAEWAFSALGEARRALKVEGVRAVVSRSPRRARLGSMPTVIAILRLRSATCFERSLVIQRYLADHDLPRSISIGVGKSGGEFTAHAWVHGFDSPANEEGYQVIRRLDPVR